MSANIWAFIFLWYMEALMRTKYFFLYFRANKENISRCWSLNESLEPLSHWNYSWSISFLKLNIFKNNSVCY